MNPKTLILKTAGINCDEELAHGFRMAKADAEIVHINELVRREKSLLDYDILGFPGGFAYGDDLSAGRVLATEVRAHLLGQLLEFYERGGLIIGICNGFQTLVKAGILPDPTSIAGLKEGNGGVEATLFWNDSGKFEDRWITLGTSAAGQVLVVCHTFREESADSATVRIYSSRRATGHERRQYEE